MPHQLACSPSSHLLNPLAFLESTLSLALPLPAHQRHRFPTGAQWLLPSQMAYPYPSCKTNGLSGHLVSTGYSSLASSPAAWGSSVDQDLDSLFHSFSLCLHTELHYSPPGDRALPSPGVQWLSPLFFGPSGTPRSQWNAASLGTWLPAAMCPLALPGLFPYGLAGNSMLLALLPGKLADYPKCTWALACNRGQGTAFFYSHIKKVPRAVQN